MKELRYAARFYQDSEADLIVVDFPDIGGVGQATQGDDVAEAHEMAQDLLDSYITVCLRQDEDPMEPQDALPEGEGWEWVYPSAKVTICWQLRRTRRLQGLTQKQVATMLGIAQETYTHWENPDKMNARIETLEKLARVFGGRLQVSLVA